MDYRDITFKLNFGNIGKKYGNKMLYDKTTTYIQHANNIYQDAKKCGEAATLDPDDYPLIQLLSKLNGYTYIPFGEAGYQKYQDLTNGELENTRLQKMIRILSSNDIPITYETLEMLTELCNSYPERVQNCNAIGIVNTITKLYAKIEELIFTQGVDPRTAHFTLQMLITRVKQKCDNNERIDYNEITRDLETLPMQLSTDQLEYIQDDLEDIRELE